MNDPKGNSKGGARKILVVDDAASVADLMREMLLSFGHQAEVCLSVDEALGMFEPGKYGLVITDYTMPRMNGIEFAKIIRERSAAQPVLLITGSAFSPADNSSRTLPINATLQKPFSVNEFQKAVSDLFTVEPAAL
jgi:CheY-like chemotaxis protein